MYTVSDIVADIGRGCIANNLNEDMFRYRIIFFVNETEKGSKHYVDAPYGGLRKALEDIIRDHLSLTNNIVIAETTVLKDGKSVCLQSRSYPLSLMGYFERISGEGREGSSKGRVLYGRYVANNMNR